MAKKIKIKQKRSLIGQSESNIRVVRALGLRGINKTVLQKDNNCTRGMINKVSHLVEYTLLND